MLINPNVPTMPQTKPDFALWAEGHDPRQNLRFVASWHPMGTMYALARAISQIAASVAAGTDPQVVNAVTTLHVLAENLGEAIVAKGPIISAAMEAEAPRVVIPPPGLVL